MDFRLNTRKYKIRKLFKLLLIKAKRKSNTFLSKEEKKKYTRLLKLRRFHSSFYIEKTKNLVKGLLSEIKIRSIRFPLIKKGFVYTDYISVKKDFPHRMPNLTFNKKVDKHNTEAFLLRKRKKKLQRRRKTKETFFYKMFPKELFKDQPMTNFYIKNIETLRINYDVLLSFHAAIGNNSKIWISPAVFSYILCIRNEMVLFDLSLIFIRLKRGLQKIFQLSKHRGSILAFIDMNKNYKFSTNGFEHFLRTWLGGYLTNYKFVMRNILAFKKKKFLSLTRRQKKFFRDLTTKNRVSVKYYFNFFKVFRRFRILGIPEEEDRKKRIPAVPQFGFCLEDHSIWLNESNKVGNNVMAICDSNSYPQYLDYPLVSNKMSLSLSFFVIKMVTESIFCGHRLDYLSFIGFNRFSEYISYQ